MAKKPIISLPINYTSTSGINLASSHPIWSFNSNAWEVEFTVTTQTHSYYVSGFSGFYDGTHVEVGDWVAVNNGNVVQITAIISATGPLLRAHVRDIDNYNINKSPVGEGLPTAADGFIFRTNNDIPLIDPGIVSKLAPQQFLDIKSRFGYFTNELSALSQFNNDAGYITETSAQALVDDVQQVSALSQLANDSGYITEASADIAYEGKGDLSALSQFNNDADYITEASADIAYEGKGDLSALSQFGNDVGYITETSAQALVDDVQQVSALSQLANDSGYITEASADVAYEGKGDLSALSQFGNDADYITESSANAAFEGKGDLSALSQFDNDAGYVTEDTATSIISQLVNDAGYVSAAQFVGSGIIDVSVSGSEIKISASETSLTGFITETSADNKYILQGTESSALSQLTNDTGFFADVQSTTLGAGEMIVVATSGPETTYRSITAGGAISLEGSPSELKLSAAPNPTNLSDLNNDTGYITEASADVAYEGKGDLSALSQFNNDAGYITETSAQALVDDVQQVSALSQLANDSGYITEASADVAYEGKGDLSALSQFNNDANYVTEDTATSIISQLVNDAGYVSAAQFVGSGIIDVSVSGSEIRISAAQTDLGDFITEASADVAYEGKGDLSALSQFNNDAGYITETSAQALVDDVQQVSALSQLTNDAGYITEASADVAYVISESSEGSGIELISVSGQLIEHKTITGGGIIEVSAFADGTVSVSAAGGTIEVQDEGVSLTTNAKLFDFRGVNVSASNSGQDITVTAEGPERYEFQVNFNASQTIDTLNPVSNLPAGWSVSSVNANDVEITHTVGKEPSTAFFFGFTVAGGYRGTGGLSSQIYLQFFPATNTSKITCRFSNASNALSEANGHVLVKLTF